MFLGWGRYYICCCRLIKLLLAVAQYCITYLEFLNFVVDFPKLLWLLLVQSFTEIFVFSLKCFVLNKFLWKVKMNPRKFINLNLESPLLSVQTIQFWHITRNTSTLKIVLFSNLLHLPPLRFHCVLYFLLIPLLTKIIPAILLSFFCYF